MDPLYLLLLLHCLGRVHRWGEKTVEGVSEAYVPTHELSNFLGDEYTADPTKYTIDFHVSSIYMIEYMERRAYKSKNRMCFLAPRTTKKERSPSSANNYYIYLHSESSAPCYYVFSYSNMTASLFLSQKKGTDDFVMLEAQKRDEHHWKLSNARHYFSQSIYRKSVP